MILPALQRSPTWAEDTALQRCNRSAVPEVGVKAGPDQLRSGSSTTSHQHQSEKPVWHDATLPIAGRASQLANANCSRFHFTLNQDTSLAKNVVRPARSTFAESRKTDGEFLHFSRLCS